MSVKLSIILLALGAVLAAALLPVIPILGVRVLIIAVVLVMFVIAGAAMGATLRGGRSGERRP